MPRAVYGAVAVIVVGLAIGLFFFSSEEPETWRADTEGFLAVATPCCVRASLWTSLDEVTPDRQRARPASAAEVVEWLNTWPYRGLEDSREGSEGEPLTVAAQSTEVRCTGKPTGDKIPQRGNEIETLEAIRNRRECTYAKWKVWSGETAARRLNERHTVWVDDSGLFHGRVDYWR